MEHGDFSALAKKYINRPAYNLNILEFISNTVAPENNNKLLSFFTNQTDVKIKPRNIWNALVSPFKKPIENDDFGSKRGYDE